ncbi:SDR family NAD(P)-dependent oxidoreductase [Allokutzneria albata]|uniref:NAD(P)-dependent dehydrogenase, short-chain alcohol dehydrogenase family n=1 Tax=Allokutzneria albata TaxID=211114 RepID=A0A1G9Z9J0_ALLAB|nr:SDR family oxidoreductase [Allokutzneria albata]SDN18020.1 NAD(P)-dependent dehydrogenase, short-chain alcohol dehydrogenase family [Allokutzneria albata]
MRRVLVTGASGGIGRAIARAFAADGAKVAVHYSTRPDQARDTLEDGVLVGGDIADPVQAKRIVDEAAAGLGGLDVLVNNAAANVAHPIATTSYEDWTAAWRRVVDVNLVGAANLSYCAAQVMRGQGSGRIINVGSRGAFRGEPDHPAYGASKAGLHALGQSLAVALAPHGISVTSVAPGFVATDRVADRLAGESGEQIRAQSPFGRAAEPEEIAAAVLWLASPEALWASGTVVDLNGASYLR